MERMFETGELAGKIKFADAADIEHSLRELGMDVSAAHSLCARQEFSRVAFLCVGGSRSYGVADAQSDLDIRGFFLPTADQILLGDARKTVDDDATDTVLHSFAKFAELAAKCSPGAVELLGVADEDIIYECETSRAIREALASIISVDDIASSFGGYTDCRLRAMKALANRDGASVASVEAEALAAISDEADAVSCALELMRADGMLDGCDVSLSGFGDDGAELSVSCDGVSANALRDIGDAVAKALTRYRKDVRRALRMDARHVSKTMADIVRCYRMGRGMLAGDGVSAKRSGAEAELLREIRGGCFLRTECALPTPSAEAIRFLEAEQKAFRDAVEGERMQGDAGGSREARKRCSELITAVHRAIVTDGI